MLILKDGVRAVEEQIRDGGLCWCIGEPYPEHCEAAEAWCGDSLAQTAEDSRPYEPGR